MDAIPDCGDPDIICNPAMDDADGDGHPDGLDCDDTNAAIHPGAAPTRAQIRSIRSACDETDL